MKPLLVKAIKAGKLYVNGRDDLCLCLSNKDKQIKWLFLPENVVWWDFFTENESIFWLRELSCDEDAEYGG